MGTKLDFKNNSYFPGYYYSMRDLNNEDSSSSSWPLFYPDSNNNNNNNNANSNDQFLNGFFPPGYDKDSLKQTMLQHEAVFKHQVIELHRLYRIQRDMMDDLRRKELQKHVIPLEMSSSSSPVAPRLLLDAEKWRKSTFSARGQSVSGAEVAITSKQTGVFPYPNRDNSEDCEILDSRPSKVMKRLFDLQLPPDQQYIDSEGENSPIDDKTIRERDGSKQGCSRGIGVELADLNEPFVQIDEETVTCVVNFNERSGKAVVDVTAKSKYPIFVGYENSSSFLDNKGKRSDWFPHMNDAVKGNNQTNLNRIPQCLDNGFETSRERKRDLFIDRRVPWLSGNPLRISEPAQATSSLLNRNSFYHGSPSVSKGATPPGFPSVGRTINCRSNHLDLPDLNKISYDGFFSHEGDGKKPDEEQQHVGDAALPWLKTKPNQLVVGRNILGFPIPSSESKAEPPPPISQGSRKEVNRRMIDINVAYDSDSEKAAPSKEVNADSRFLIDLNSCLSEDELPLPPLIKSGSSLWRGGVQIDLEAPPVEEPDDDIIAPDNHTPAEEEEEEGDTRSAAEAIVAISTTAPISDDNEKTSWLPLGEDSMEDPLSWFAEILIPSSPLPLANVISHRSSSSSSLSLDEFELMTLNLPELEEEDYMPKPLVPLHYMEEDDISNARTGTVSSIANRTRRGPGRRGRQRRDFQRDILPGLASLSRHEVTEDIQTFGGLMRATGHHWQSGITRRNGSRNGSGRGRGRRPSAVTAVQVTTGAATTTPGPSSSTDCTQLIQQMNCADDRSITDWGKTPRRPRRQRSCPQGNNNNNNNPQTTVLLA